MNATLFLILVALFVIIVLPRKFNYIFFMLWSTAFGTFSYLNIPSDDISIIYTLIHMVCLIGYGNLWHKRIVLGKD